jgi:hypothetical protein
MELRAFFSTCVLVLITTVAAATRTPGIDDLSKFASTTYHDTVWIVNGMKPLDEKFKKWKFDFVLDARKTLLSNTSASLLGLRFGAEYRRVHRFGLGLYGLSNDVYVNSLFEVDTTVAEGLLNLSYASLFYERVMFFNPKWEWLLTGHLGVGSVKGSYRYAGEKDWISYEKNDVRPLEFSTMLYYHITWWCSAGVGLGYRFMLNTPEEIRPIYTAPVGIARLRIKLGRLTRSIWDKDVKYQY